MTERAKLLPLLNRPIFEARSTMGEENEVIQIKVQWLTVRERTFPSGCLYRNMKIQNKLVYE